MPKGLPKIQGDTESTKAQQVLFGEHDGGRALENAFPLEIENGLILTWIADVLHRHLGDISTGIPDRTGDDRRPVRVKSRAYPQVVSGYPLELAKIVARKTVALIGIRMLWNPMG